MSRKGEWKCWDSMVWQVVGHGAGRIGGKEGEEIGDDCAWLYVTLDLLWHAGPTATCVVQAP